jgi:hypothetical protein
MVNAWWLVAAAVVGAFFGMAVICFCVAARDADRELEEFERRLKDAGRF